MKILFLTSLFQILLIQGYSQVKEIKTQPCNRNEVVFAWERSAEGFHCVGGIKYGANAHSLIKNLVVRKFDHDMNEIESFESDDIALGKPFTFLGGNDGKWYFLRESVKRSKGREGGQAKYQLQVIAIQANGSMDTLPFDTTNFPLIERFIPGIPNLAAANAPTTRKIMGTANSLNRTVIGFNVRKQDNNSYFWYMNTETGARWEVRPKNPELLFNKDDEIVATDFYVDRAMNIWTWRTHDFPEKSDPYLQILKIDAQGNCTEFKISRKNRTPNCRELIEDGEKMFALISVGSPKNADEYVDIELHVLQERTATMTDSKRIEEKENKLNYYVGLRGSNSQGTRFEGQWYIALHRLAYGSSSSAALDFISFTVEDGKIKDAQFFPRRVGYRNPGDESAVFWVANGRPYYIFKSSYDRKGTVMGGSDRYHLFVQEIGQPKESAQALFNGRKTGLMMETIHEVNDGVFRVIGIWGNKMTLYEFRI